MMIPMMLVDSKTRAPPALREPPRKRHGVTLWRRRRPSV